jgi:YesN/AraC family two-component response regulator
MDLRINYLIQKLDENPILRKHSIEALADSIGYKNASSFTRIFKNYTGISPSKYFKQKYG